MTISAQGVRVVYNGSGSTGPFSLTDADAAPILFADNAEIVVTKFSSAGVPSILTINTHYTLTGAGLSTAGSVTLVSPLAVGEQLVLQRVTPRTQVIDLISGGKLGNAIIEGFFDKLIRIDQERFETDTRTLRFPINYTGETMFLPLPEADKSLAWNSDGDGLVNRATTSAFLHGVGVPDDDDLGATGDFYLDTSALLIYGPKTGGSWGSPASIVGPQGPQGIQGIQGPPGAPGAGTGDVVGPASAVSGRIATFNGTTGKIIQDSGLSSTSFYAPGGTDVAIADGGTGASSAAAAFTALKQDATESATGVVELATTAEALAGTDTARAVTAAGLAAATIMQGKHAIPISAAAMSPRASNGAATGTFGIGIPTLDFDAASTEFAVFAIAMPKSWNEGTVTFVPYWTNASGLSTETVRWTLAGVALSNDDAGAAPSFGTAQNSDDTWIAQNDIHIGPESSAITIGGSPAQDDIVFFQISRDTANDNLTGDAKLIAIKLFLTFNAPTDA